MCSFTIGNKSYSGQSISIINGVVTIDGVVQGGDKLTGIVKIEITGVIANVTVDAPLMVNGDVLGNVDCEGAVTCGAVGGNVDADAVTCGCVAGDVDADVVNCGDVDADIVNRS